MKRVAVLDDYQDAVRALPVWSRLAGRVRLEVHCDPAPDAAALIERLRGVPIVVPIRERTRFPAALLERLPDLEHLALTGKNSGHVDAGAATACGVLVTATDGSGPAAAEHAMALILSAARRIPAEDRALRAGRPPAGLGLGLAGKTLGIVGLGRIGTRIAAFGGFLGMRVLAWSANLDAARAEAAGATRVELDELLRESDVVSLHLRLSQRTRGVLGARELARMKPGALLVNTARGELLDEAALVDALRRRRLGGAALDVFASEPLPREHPLRSLDNAVLTPHTGFVTDDAYALFFEQAVENIDAGLRGEIPARALNPEVLRRG